jgi:lysophospholipase L1-like esterase
MIKNLSSKIFFILIVLKVSAQVSPFAVEDYPFVKKEHNKIVKYGNDDAFRKLHKKMEKVFLTGNGQVNIVHFGGSHIQADVWSNQVRNNLNNIMPGVSGPRGLIFPYKIAKTNGSWYYNIDYTGNWVSCRNVIEKDRDKILGLSGISVTTQDTLANIKIAFNEELQSLYAHSRIKIFYHYSDSSFQIKPANDEVFTQKSDTISGMIEFSFSEKKDTINLEIFKSAENQNYFSLHGISVENDNPGIIYHSIGVNGASVPSYNRCQLLSEQIKHLQPDLILFSIGINDANDPDFSAARYEQNYDTLLAAIKKAAPDAAFIFTSNTDSYYKKKHPNKNALEAKKVMIRLAEKHHGALWDLHAIMGGLGSIKQWEAKGMAKKDLVHLSNNGYKIIGDLLYNAILNSYLQYTSGNP